MGRDRPAEEILTQGNAGEEILKLAAEESTGLLVLGPASGRAAPGAGRPTGQTVAREARCPVLFVHGDEASAISRPFSADSQIGAASGCRLTPTRYPIGFEASRPFFDSQG